MQRSTNRQRPFKAFTFAFTFAFTAVILLFGLSTNTNINTNRIYFVEAFSVLSRGSYYRSTINSNSNSNNSNNRLATIPTSIQKYTSKGKRVFELAAAKSNGNDDNDNDNDADDVDNRTQQPSPIRNIVIAGGGIMGTSVAYYLVEDHFKQQLDGNGEQQVTITLVDPTGAVGSCASGKAGGFLARDWRNGTPLQELQQMGFALHEQLSETLSGIDYRRLTCAAVAVDESEEDDEESSSSSSSSSKRVPNKPPSKKLMDLEWVDPDVVLWNEEELGGTPGVYPMGDEESIAQVHPRKLCEQMWNFVEKQKGISIASVELIQGKIVKAKTEQGDDDERFMTGVELDDGRILPSDVLVAACGPWTYEANQWFDDNSAVLPQITGIKCHSILVPSKSGKPNTQAVFFDSNGAIGADGDLEVYPRPDGDNYVNGFANEETICTEPPGQEAIEEDKIALLREAMDFVENVGKDAISEERQPAPRDHTQQVCYWPETPHGYPIIGKIPQIEGAYVASE